MTKTTTKTKTQTKCLKNPTYAIFLKSWWLTHSKYDDGYLTLVTLFKPVTLVTLFQSYNQFYRAECITVSGFFGSSLFFESPSYHLWQSKILFKNFNFQVHLEDVSLGTLLDRMWTAAFQAIRDSNLYSRFIQDKDEIQNMSIKQEIFTKLQMDLQKAQTEMLKVLVKYRPVCTCTLALWFLPWVFQMLACFPTHLPNSFLCLSYSTSPTTFPHSNFYPPPYLD